MAGGDLAAFERVQPILALYSQHQQHFGASGAGQAQNGQSDFGRERVAGLGRGHHAG